MAQAGIAAGRAAASVGPVQRPNRVIAAALLVTAAMAGIGYVDNYVRVIAEDAGVWQFHLMRSAMALPLILLLARFMRQPLRPLNPARVLGRSLLAGLAMLAYFASLGLLPIGQVVAGLFTAPIFVLLISAAVYGVRVGPWQIAAVLLGFAGILLVLRPDPASLSALSVLPVLAGLLYAMSNIATREWCAQEHFVTVLAGFFLCLLALGLIGLAVLALAPQPVPTGAEGFLLRGWVAPTVPVLFWIGAQALGSVFAVAMIIRAYQIAEAPLVAVFENTLLVSAVVWAWVIWGETLDAAALAGIAAIAVAGAMVALLPRPGAAPR